MILVDFELVILVFGFCSEEKILAFEENHGRTHVGAHCQHPLTCLLKAWEWLAARQSGALAEVVIYSYIQGIDQFELFADHSNCSPGLT